MNKQALSVADFALILNLVNEELYRIERAAPYRILREKDELVEKYKSLSHLKNSLENLNVELSHQHEDKGENK